jgi:hypothetical protein
MLGSHDMKAQCGTVAIGRLHTFQVYHPTVHVLGLPRELLVSFILIALFLNNSMPPLNVTSSSLAQPALTRISYQCPVFIATLTDPVLRYCGVSPTFCDEKGLHGSQHVVLLMMEVALSITATRVIWKIFSYFSWWRAIWREVNRTREELGLMAEEEW